jgi:hypothetical protein
VLARVNCNERPDSLLIIITSCVKGNADRFEASI